MKILQIMLAVALLSVAACASHRPAPAAAAQIDPKYPVITKLVGRRQTIVISAGPASALYTVQTPAGTTLVANASLDDLRANHPEYFRLVQPVVATEAAFILADVGE